MPLRRHFAWPGYAALAATATLAIALPAAVEAAMWWPLVASLVVLGLPHGAVDHHVAGRLGASLGRRPLMSGYAALVVLGLVLWWIAPAVALATFLLVAAVHWGLGDVWFARYVGGRARFGARWRLAAFVAARGLLPVALPLLAFPAQAAEGTGAILQAVGGDGTGWAPAGGLRIAGLAAVALAVAVGLTASLLDHRNLDGGGARRDAAELVLLAVTFAVAPPVFAVGMYFMAWHSLRHVARLMATAPDQARLLAAHRVLAALAAWHREAAPLTAVSLTGLLVLAATVWQVPASAAAVTGAALAFIAALTLPHAIAVAAMDRLQLTGAVVGAATPAAGAHPVATAQTPRRFSAPG